jgi:2-succinyl-5-enolpyruvyl-6-hydroxy-3-cyclohexene-1-carboxylate synthase
VTLLLGDISFLHDVGSLWAAAPSRTHAGGAVPHVVIVVLNNGGGRIFEQLPIASHAGVALELWTTPHAIRLRAAAELYGISYAEASDAAALTRALDAAYAHAAVTLIEVIVEPDNVTRSQRALSAELEPQFEALLTAVRA